MTQFYGTLTPEKTEREEKNMQLVRKGAGECMVLLENDGVLPLKKIGKIALYGAGARHTIKGGTGSGDVNSREVINIEQGLKDAGFTITTDRWLTAYDELLKEAKTAHQAEVNLWRRKDNSRRSSSSLSFPSKNRIFRSSRRRM